MQLVAYLQGYFFNKQVLYCQWFNKVVEKNNEEYVLQICIFGFEITLKSV